MKFLIRIILAAPLWVGFQAVAADAAKPVVFKVRSTLPSIVSLTVMVSAPVSTVRLFVRVNAEVTVAAPALAVPTTTRSASMRFANR